MQHRRRVVEEDRLTRFDELERGDADVAPATPSGLLRALLACLGRTTPPTTRVAQTADAWEAAFEQALRTVWLAAAPAPPARR